jgi:hypothetical protein
MKHHSITRKLNEFSAIKTAWRGSAPITVTMDAPVSKWDMVTVYESTFTFTAVTFDVVAVDGDTVTLQRLTVADRDALGVYA